MKTCIIVVATARSSIDYVRVHKKFALVVLIHTFDNYGVLYHKISVNVSATR
jgi:hypothetical protein